MKFTYDQSIIALKQVGALAQLVARRVRNAKVTGSNPVCSTKSTVVKTRLIVREDYCILQRQAKREGISLPVFFFALQLVISAPDTWKGAQAPSTLPNLILQHNYEKLLYLIDYNIAKFTAKSRYFLPISYCPLKRTFLSVCNTAFARF